MLQKVITVQGYMGSSGENKFNETEHPLINEALKDGYLVHNTIPLISNTHSSYAVVFILHKP